MTTVYKSSQAQVLTEAAHKLNELLNENGDKPVLFLFAGGSALELLPLIKPQNLDSNITFAPSDDRYSFDEKVNNFLQMMFLDGFYANAIENGCTFISTYPDQMETMEEVADRFEVALRKWRRTNPDGIVIMTMGIGPDGHTCGMMPYPEDPESFNQFFDNEERWVAAYDALEKNEYPLRISVTMPFLRSQVDYAVVYACGENKREAIKRRDADAGSLAETPARIHREMKENALFTDVKL